VNLRWIDSKSKPRPAREQRLQRAGALDPRQLMAEAEMNSRAEGDVAIWLAFEIELLRPFVHRRVHVRGGEHDHDAIALLQRHAIQLDIPTQITRF